LIQTTHLLIDMSEIQELAPPHSIHGASHATELVRIWIVDGNQHISITGNLWKDLAAWGLMLVDLAKHVANAYAAQGQDRDAALNRVLAGFRAEMEMPTDEPGPLGPTESSE